MLCSREMSFAIQNGPGDNLSTVSESESEPDYGNNYTGEGY